MAQYKDAEQHWNKRFESPDYLFGTEPNRWLAQHAQVWTPGQRVLCVADGEGRNSVWLAQRGLQVDAFDISPVGVEKARKLAQANAVQVRYEVNDCDGFAWPQTQYDGVAVIFIQFADPDMRARIFTHCMEALKPGGTLILQGYTPRQLEYKTGGPGVLENLYTTQLLRDAFARLDITTLVEYEEELSEGKQHKGMSALVGMVARKPAA